MIIEVETALASIFEQLPPVYDALNNEFKVKFNWGTQDVLNKYIALPESTSKYPLIWLVNGENEANTANSRVNRTIRLILAKNSDFPEQFNDFQYQTDYRVVLTPLLKNVLKVLERSGISRITGNFTYDYLPNYSETEGKTKTLGYWNAIVLDVPIELHGQRCLRTINGLEHIVLPPTTPTNNKKWEKFTFTAEQGQTTYDLPFTPSLTFVILNEVSQTEGLRYSVTGKTVNFLVDIQENDLIQITAFK